MGLDLGSGGGSVDGSVDGGSGVDASDLLQPCSILPERPMELLL